MADILERRRPLTPQAALAAVWAHIEGPPPADPDAALADLAHRAAQGGLDNDAILHLLDRATSQWDTYPRIWERWTKLLAVLRQARGAYPADPAGAAWQPDGGHHV